MRILYVHSVMGQLGDKIRVSKVYFFLRKKGFDIYEKWINVRKGRGLFLSLIGLRQILLSPKEHNTVRIKSPLEVLANSFSNSVQQQILREATIVRPQVIVAEGSLVGYLSLMAKNNLNVPLVTDVHGLLGVESQIGASRYSEMILNMERIAFQESDYLLTVSMRMKREICLKQKVQADKVFVVPNGGDVHRFQARFGLPLNVIYAGNFAPYEKVSDYLELAKAVGHTSHFVFFLAGEGVQRKKILSKISKEKIPIKFKGLKTRQEIFRIFSNMHVGFVPSTSGLERVVAFPIKVLDYMSCGLPVVAPKIGDWGDLIERENCGIAINENSVPEFIKALYLLCDKEEWGRKSRNGKECIEKEYRWDLVLEPLGALMKKIAA